MYEQRFRHFMVQFLEMERRQSRLVVHIDSDLIEACSGSGEMLDPSCCYRSPSPTGHRRDNVSSFHVAVLGRQIWGCGDSDGPRNGKRKCGAFTGLYNNAQSVRRIPIKNVHSNRGEQVVK
jgi:hypothetical protein